MRIASPPSASTSASLTSLTTCWAGFRASWIRAPIARSRMRSSIVLTTTKLTSASSNAKRISRRTSSTSDSRSVPLLRNLAKMPSNRSDSDSNMSARAYRAWEPLNPARSGASRMSRWELTPVAAADHQAAVDVGHPGNRGGGALDVGLARRVGGAAGEDRLAGDDLDLGLGQVPRAGRVRQLVAHPLGHGVVAGRRPPPLPLAAQLVTQVAPRCRGRQQADADAGREEQRVPQPDEPPRPVGRAGGELAGAVAGLGGHLAHADRRSHGQEHGSDHLSTSCASPLGHAKSASTNSSGSNSTRSPTASPNPTSLIGMPSPVSMASAMPPLAEPSSLVSTTPVTSTASVNCSAWARPF